MFSLRLISIIFVRCTDLAESPLQTLPWLAWH